MDINGVYRVPAAAVMEAITSLKPFPSAQRLAVPLRIMRPNGIAVVPGSSPLRLLIGSSNSTDPHWQECTLPEADALPTDPGATVPAECREFASAIPHKTDSKTGQQLPGNPDGLKIDCSGNVWATGPGGIIVFDKLGKTLGYLRTGIKTGNLAFTADGFLYVTAKSQLLRMRLTTQQWKCNSA